MLTEKQNTITSHVIQFSRFLRKHRFTLGPQEEIQSLEALKCIPYNDPFHFKNALRSTMVKNKNQLDRFDDLYLQYWSEISRAENAKRKNVAEKKETPKVKPQAPSIQVIKKWLHGNHQKDEITMASYSSEDVFTEKDFHNFAKDDVAQTLKLSKALVIKLSNKKGRRYVSSKKKNQIDLKKIIRSNITSSEELIKLKFKQKKIEKLKLVLICDVSRSMELYTKFLLQFMYGLNQATTKIETFVFSTSLVRITKNLQNHDFSLVLSDLKGSFDQWSGGTKIGRSLEAFINQYASYTLDTKTKVIILSDGWETDDPGITANAMSEIKKKVSKIIWLNPLADNPNFKPDVACLQAAWAYIDVFQAANSIASLEALVKKL